MPFKSEAQRKFLFAKHPKIAKKFAKITPKEKKLPKKLKKSNNEKSKKIEKFIPHIKF